MWLVKFELGLFCRVAGGNFTGRWLLKKEAWLVINTTLEICDKEKLMFMRLD